MAKKKNPLDEMFDFFGINDITDLITGKKDKADIPGSSRYVPRASSRHDRRITHVERGREKNCEHRHGLWS